MAKSRLIVNRKKSTVLVSTRTLQEAIRRANMLVETLMQTNPNDSRINSVEGAVQHMSRILNANPQQMQQDGAQSVSDYMDDAKMPAEARKLKQEVDMISKLSNEVRAGQEQPAVPQHAGQPVNYVPDSAVAEGGIHASQKSANGGAAFVTDRDDKAEAKSPEVVSVPRLAVKRKKKEAEDPAPEAAAIPAAAPAAAPAPMAEPVSKTNVIDYIPTETLIKVIEDLPKEEDFAQNKQKQDALIELTNVLKARPVLPPEQPSAPKAPEHSSAPALAGAPAAAPVASSKKAELGDHAMGDSGTISNGSGASATVGAGGSVNQTQQVPTKPEPKEPTTGFGGLNLSSALEEKTADDYRIQDYKITDEGIRPSGGLPSMDEQEEYGVPGQAEFSGPSDIEPISASTEKVAVTPPGISEELMHKLKKQYPGEPDKAYATAWKIHNEKSSALKAISAALEKFASAGYGGGWYTSYKPMEVDEDGGRTPEIGEAHRGLEDHTGIARPDTTMPIKLNEQQGLKTGAKVAAEMTTSKAVKEAERFGNDLKKTYLDAKSLTQVNDTRAVREAVEAIFRAADLFDEATKVLSKQDQQEKSEEEAAKIKADNKKKSSFGGLAVAAGE